MNATREHHVQGVPPNWSRVGQGFQPLTHRDDDWRHPSGLRRPQAVRCASKAAPRARFPRLQALWQRLRDRNAWLPANREDRDAVMFAWGELYMLGICGGVIALIHFL